jgi:hypothetical protein
LFFHPKPPPPPPEVQPLLFLPPPTATTDTDVTPVGATHVYVPDVVKASCPAAADVVMLLLAALAALTPIALVAVTVNV